MAHLRDLPMCDKGCGKRAVVEIFNRVNASMGKFCAPHGKECLKALEKAEAER